MNKAKINEILDEHKMWLNTIGKEGRRAMLRDVDLDGTDLSHADLRYADLCDADLSCADLYHADLHDADLRAADLRYADLRAADLSGADLYHANLRYANLHDADLRAADLRYADLRDADLSCADLYHADLRDADLSAADLDYSSFPLWCGGLDVNIDDRQATQLLYHLIRNVNYSKNTSESFKKICRIESLVKQANNFYRAEECGIIKEDIEDESKKNGAK